MAKSHGKLAAGRTSQGPPAPRIVPRQELRCQHRTADMFPSKERYLVSKKLHDENWTQILGKAKITLESALSKLELSAEEYEFTPLERAALLAAKRKSTGAGLGNSGGPKSPADVLRAMLGFAVPVLGRYAMNMAMEWLNSEIKYAVFTIAQVVTTTSNYYILNGIAQGVDFNQRVGNSIRILGMDWYAQVLNQHADALQELRYWIGVDTQSDGAAPTDATLFEGGSATAAGLVPYIKTAPDRYAILHDKSFCLDAAVNAIQSERVGFKDLVQQDLHTLFEGTTSAVTSISRGAIFAVMVSTDAANGVTLNLNGRVFYTDN